MDVAGFKKVEDLLANAGGVLEADRGGRPHRPEETLTPKPGSDTPPATIRGVPEGRLGETLENFDLDLNPEMAPALQRCRAVAAGQAWCALLGGPPGTGKTHLAIAVLNEWMATGEHGYFWTVPDFLDWLRREAFDEGGPGLEYALRGYREGRGGLVCFDDLGTENPTDWAHEQLYRMLDSRYNLRLPTIITTNQPLERIDGRLRSRFREGLVVCRGRDVRRTRKEAGMGNPSSRREDG